MKYGYINPAIQVYPFDNRPEIKVLIVPNETWGEGFRDFYLINEKMGDPVYMFGCKAETDREAAHLAHANAIDYTPLSWLGQEPEPAAPLRLCWRCLAGLECKEGPQSTIAIEWDEDDENDDFRCDWCDSDMEDTLYEL